MELIITQPDDWHLHLRDGAGMQDVAKHSAAQFGRAIIMPNLKPPVTTVDEALEYRARILRSLGSNSGFNPLMTLYLTDNTTVADIEAASASEHVVAAKLYPAGATTNSDAGVTDIKNMAPIFDAMQEHGIVLCIHGEVVQHDVDIFDREARFVDSTLRYIVDTFPGLKVVMEHITTSEAAEFLQSAREGVGATITPQHLLYNRNHMLVGGVRPHYYCLPILKREAHRAALCKLVASGSTRAFLGTDSAPHAKHTKENACGCAGVFSAHAAINFYAEAFEAIDALDHLEAFASLNGPAFYGFAPNTRKMKLTKQAFDVPAEYQFGEHTVVPLRASETVSWTAELLD
ncbi:MAG: dihydroorotase [Gammaproteobacteria bacterium]|nr:dihydroorotase [Gammaproteobacteria bacterium]